MSVKAIQPSLSVKKRENQPSFGSMSLLQVPVVVMDGIERGGFAASFIIQDGLGFITPRIWKGLTRPPIDPATGLPKPTEYDENGKPIKKYNWDFARKEGVREILTGPSSFFIPLGIVAAVKKYSGAANNIKLNYINGFKDNFIEFASKNPEMNNKALFYENLYENVLKTSINSNLNEGKLSGAKITEIAKNYAQRQINIDEQFEKMKNKSFWSRRQDKKAVKELQKEFVKDFTDLKKQYLPASSDFTTAELKTSGKTVKGSFKDFVNSVRDYTGDAIKNTKKAVSNGGSIEKAVENFTHRRMGTRVLTNISSILGIAVFWTVIPKIYNMGLKHNPAFTEALDKAKNEHAGKAPDSPQKNASKEVSKEVPKEVSFGGGASSFFTKTGKSVFERPNLKKVSDFFELNGPVIPATGMLALLYGACIPPRLVQSHDKYDLAEIVTRDASSFFALMFGAKALSRIFSNGFAKLSGLALNVKPKDHNKSTLTKIGNYLKMNGGVDVLSNGVIESKYSDVGKYKNGINGLLEFIDKNGGNVKKALSLDKNIKQETEKLLGKKLKDASKDEIKAAFSKDSDAAKEITRILKNSKNKLVNSAKTMNSFFGFISTIVLIPLFIASLADICDKMTRRRRAKDIALEKAAAPAAEQQNEKQSCQMPHMCGKNMSQFLGNRR
ncbi:MAG: hypothetical protein LBK53_07830 [Heliobacteriaceae bacterium]|jgi:hypothetical protein|nr:hypothetical protein [Heliobacteriaceae bacterium]